jgi:hypothetical protein
MNAKNLWRLIAPLAITLILRGCKDPEVGNCDESKLP